MTERIEVVIVGGGQAGLAVSRELTEAGIAHVVLERGRVGQSWRGRWDSFCLVTPNWFVQLPGHPYDGGDPDGFMLRDEVVAYLERARRGSRLRCEKVSRSPGSGRGPTGVSSWRPRPMRSWPGRWSSAPAPTSGPTDRQARQRSQRTSLRS